MLQILRYYVVSSEVYRDTSGCSTFECSTSGCSRFRSKRQTDASNFTIGTNSFGQLDSRWAFLTRFTSRSQLEIFVYNQIIKKYSWKKLYRFFYIKLSIILLRFKLIGKSISVKADS